MDKLNYTLRSEEIQELKRKIQKIFRKICNQLSQKNILKRKRVVVDYKILTKATIMYVINNLSYQRLSDMIALKYYVCMSDTAWKKQLRKTIPIFYDVVLKLLKKKSKAKTYKNEMILGYSSVHAIDATDIPLQGKKGSLIRVNTKYCISETPSFEAVIKDIHTGESAKLFDIEPSNLYIADRAYGKTSQMGFILEKKADFIFRFSPSQVRLFTDSECTTKFEMIKYLTSPDVSFSLNCFFKYDGNVYPVRIIASPLPEHERDKAAAQVKKKSAKKQRKIQNSTILYSGWMFIATSLSIAHSDEDIINVYRRRWQIELHFKRSKTLLRFHVLRRCSILYAYNTVKAWVAVSALIYSLFLTFYDFFDLCISEFNLFSLFAFFIS